ncbi:MAG: alpha/beta hydrolase family protein [Planctomycetota bacterium]|jgi:pimeloyl-ACP methyl ester carboxylesterase
MPRETFKIVIIAAVLSSCAVGCTTAGDTAGVAPSLTGTRSDWHGYDKYDFVVDGRKCHIVAPKTAAPGNPWLWRARFPGYCIEPDLALLSKGYHLAYIDVAGMWGNPTAVGHWDAFYKYMTQAQPFAARPALKGVSRGGKIVYNWAARNPQKVSCIYCIVPVCRFAVGPPEGEDGKDAVDHLEALAAAKVPILHVCGDADDKVPYEEHTKPLYERYTKLGGRMQVIVLKGDHFARPKDPAPIVEFILKHTSPGLSAEKGK